MRMKFVAAVIGALLFVPAAGAAVAAEPEPAPGKVMAPDGTEYDLSLIPIDDKEAMRKLERTHRRFARLGDSRCGPHQEISPFQAGHVRPPIGGCQQMMVDGLVEKESNPALSAYHYMMVPLRRYDPDRPPSYERIVVKKVRKRLEQEGAGNEAGGG